MKKIKYVKVDKDRFERTLDPNKVLKVYKEWLEWCPSGRHLFYLVYDEQLGRCRSVKANRCTLVKEIEVTA